MENAATYWDGNSKKVVLLAAQPYWTEKVWLDRIGNEFMNM